ncbi:MAG: winged helix-turn-helix domain-containing protein, partial [Acidiferrobacterales bacterium]|nr:winged helix-turn-helix domain-containing protein [Acidiferrobacterales bacterium]
MDENDLLPHEPFEIGDWVVDPDSGRLRRGDDEVKLEPKVMAVLVYLAQQPGKVFSREELESTVWAGTVVGYDALSNSVIKLRKALGDDR